MSKRTIHLNVPFITRLEGEASLELDASEGKLEQVHLKIFEPPRLFEQFLVGKRFSDVPELSARICGICPMAYQLTSILAMEKLFNVQVPESIEKLRRIMNLAEWIQSHALHIHFLALPDFLGFNNGLEMAKAHPDIFNRGIQLQAFGNRILALLGGRSVHPIGLRVGGFEALPQLDELLAMQSQAEEARKLSKSLVNYLATLSIPDYPQPFDYVSLKSAHHYPVNQGHIVSASGLDIDSSAYTDHFREHQEPHSTALYSLLDGYDYLVGPLARFNHNFSQLDIDTQQLGKSIGQTGKSKNMYDSILIRALEIHYACQEILTLLTALEIPAKPYIEVTPRAGTTCYATEAPRGLIYHRYQFDEAGKVLACSIIPPTSQNQARIEKDLRNAVPRYGLEHSDQELKQFCEQLIRNYDPCISCSTHFLTFKVNRASNDKTANSGNYD
ncbi:Ni/Fe hydrogenase subunit alpha [Vibrio hangzhouensis]|uniref:Ni/Fe hydrogenase subunit alpha n=1 Tax=Vibrio hangzhouensis TaxID=462991 RepID=UPI001C976C78|nr:Ni/Fe hydrogenase subunit alpha [Vibrio hangzhouensis]MBY6196416.1 Ni/Fe hydrogenase subunit alpha [Vibrio hangzhouensis]